MIQEYPTLAGKSENLNLTQMDKRRFHLRDKLDKLDSANYPLHSKTTRQQIGTPKHVYSFWGF